MEEEEAAAASIAAAAADSVVAVEKVEKVNSLGAPPSSEKKYEPLSLAKIGRGCSSFFSISGEKSQKVKTQ